VENFVYPQILDICIHKIHIKNNSNELSIPTLKKGEKKKRKAGLFEFEFKFFV
jgi:hypothetical protein